MPGVIKRPIQPSRSVLTYGRFDGFQTSHAKLLADLSSMGTEVIVGCATDAFCAQVGNRAATPFETRRAILESCRYVTRVIAWDSWDQRRTDIVNYNVSVLALRGGNPGMIEDLHDIVQVVNLPAGPIPHWNNTTLKSA